ncbi:hypothetical protein [Pontibacter pudoricolor]|uniref:hypothetical protein n=1 Tax=Pontibacter pudoricolor TaxID=2694930 RepID=UPI00139166C9|nr:hypothetical protein [Pontibacter pudoricolor]
MKTYILTLALGLITTAGFAQRITKGDDGLDKKVLEVQVTGPALLTLEMERELQLTAQQQQEVKQLNELRYQQLLETEKTATAVSNDQMIQKVHLQNDKALTKVLSSEQLRRFLELEGRQHAQHLSELDNH